MLVCLKKITWFILFNSFTWHYPTAVTWKWQLQCILRSQHFSCLFLWTKHLVKMCMLRRFKPTKAFVRALKSFWNCLADILGVSIRQGNVKVLYTQVVSGPQNNGCYSKYVLVKIFSISILWWMLSFWERKEAILNSASQRREKRQLPFQFNASLEATDWLA